MMKIKEITINGKQIEWKSEQRIISVPYCPICKKELKYFGKEYHPYYCDCGDWYLDYDADDEIYHIKKN